MDNPLLGPTLDDLRRHQGLKWRLYGDDVLPLWVAEMDVFPPEPVVRAVTDAMRRGDTGYPWARDYAEAVAGFAERHWGWAPDPGRARLVPNVMLGISEVLQAGHRARRRRRRELPRVPAVLRLRPKPRSPRRRGAARPPRVARPPDAWPRRSARRRGEAATRHTCCANPHNPTGRGAHRRGAHRRRRARGRPRGARGGRRDPRAARLRATPVHSLPLAARGSAGVRSVLGEQGLQPRRTDLGRRAGGRRGPARARRDAARGGLRGEPHGRDRAGGGAAGRR